MEELVLYFSLKYEGDFQNIYKALLNKEKVDEQLKNKLFKKLKCQYTTIFSDDYPEGLKNINCPPFVLYYYGDLSLVNTKTIGVTGMREPSEYGIEATKIFISNLIQNNYTVISGMARGIEGVVHQSAIDSKGHTIAVLGSGIEYCYPLRHRHLYEEMKKNHLIISEYPLTSAPKQQMFTLRNRIIAGLSKSVLVIEAKEKSNTMTTVGYALEQGKEVYAVPSGVFNNNGCNLLIQHGAKIVLNVNDIIEDEYMR